MMRVRMNGKYVKLSNKKLQRDRLNRVKGSGLIHNNVVRSTDPVSDQRGHIMEPVKHNLKIGKRLSKKNIKLVF